MTKVCSVKDILENIVEIHFIVENNPLFADDNGRGEWMLIHL